MPSATPSRWRDILTAKEVWKLHLQYVLEMCGHNQTLAAQILRCDRKTVNRWVRRLELKRKAGAAPSLQAVLGQWGTPRSDDRALHDRADVVCFTLTTKAGDYRLYRYDGTLSAAQQLCAVEPRLKLRGQTLVVDPEGPEPVSVRHAPVWLVLPAKGFLPQVVRCEVSLDALLQMLA